MEIDQKIIGKVLELYKPEARVLVRGQIEYPVLRGEFTIPPTFYMTSPSDHVADIEVQLCLNQLSYAGLAQIIEREELPELRGLTFRDLQREGCLVIESRKKFRRRISTDKPINGEIKITDFIDNGNMIFGHAGIDFEKRSCIGDLTLALLRNPSGWLTV